MIDSNTIDSIRRDLEGAQRDYSRAKRTIEQTRSQLADFVLANTALISQGEKIDLSAYEDAIKDAEFDRDCAENSFKEAKERLINLANRLCLFD